MSLPVPEAERIGPVTSLLESAVAGGIPGLVAMLGHGPTVLRRWVAGQADTNPARPMRPGTIFDLASLTKVVATTTVTLALVSRGELALDDPVTGYLPRFEACRTGPVTVRHLLTHTSGLPQGRKFHRWCRSRDELLSDLYQTSLQARPGARVLYSDLGFMALGEVVATVTGVPLDRATADLVTGPLAMTDTGFNPPGPPERFAATEVITGPAGHGPAWSGTVHDENARLMGGVAGHAGLFASAADLARFAAWWVSDADTVVPAALRRAAATCQTTPGRQTTPDCQTTPGRRGFGWVCSGGVFDILGGHWPPTAVSHTGFTGTSLALDPVSGLWLVLLTNAVHAGRDATAVQALRRAVHAAVTATPP
jgi:CubicO group peptidase (beta-lactamase class C family)